MPRGSFEDRESQDRSWRRRVRRLGVQRQHESRMSGFRSLILSGSIDHILITPTEALDKMVFSRIPDPDSGYSALHKSSIRVKPFYGSNKAYWDDLVAMGYGETTVGELKARSGDEQAARSLEQAFSQNLIEFDEFQLSRALGRT